LKLGRKADGGKYTEEEAKALSIEEVKKMIEEQVPNAFTKKAAAAKKGAVKKTATKKAVKKVAKKK
jgi:DNA topoisomerase-1